MSPFILASTSPFRQQLLTAAGLSFDAQAPAVDEVAVAAALRERHPGASPREVVVALAEAKAQDVAGRHPGRVVVGADQILEIDGEVIGKPADAADAARRLRQLSGRAHRLMTAVALVGGPAPASTFVEETVMTLRTLTPDEVTAYVETGEWQGCAGGYRVEGRGIQLMDRIDGDFHNIIGLPLLPLLRALRARGLP